MYPATSYSSLRASSKTSHRISRSFCSSPQLSWQQTASLPHWLVRTMVVFQVNAMLRIVLCELHQIGEYCWSDADGACVLDRLLGRLLDDSVVIGCDNKHSCAWRRRVRRRWHGGTWRPPPTVHHNQHQTVTIEPLCSKLEEANCVNLVLDCADLALVLFQVHTCYDPSISPIRVWR